MRKKQLLAFLMAGALSVGMTPAAAFAAEDTAVEASGEEVAGELDGTEICNVFLLSSSPLFNRTRHFPQAPFPEHGASMATLAPRATSSKLSPALANASTTLPSSNENVTLNIRQPPFS